jgi:hypothetical protein
MIDHFEEEQVVRDWNSLIQGKTEPVMKFFGRYDKALATYKLYEGLTYEQELKNFLDKLRIETQMALRIYMRIKPFETSSIEDIIDSVKTLEQAAGIKDEPAVHVTRKEERYTDRSRKTEKGILRARKVPKFASSKKWKFWGQVGVCWSCGKMGHKVSGCPDLGKAKSDEKPKVKEAPAANTASVEPLPARKMPVVDWEIEATEEGDQSETISCLLDTGSETTMARTEMKDCAENVCMTDVGLSGVGSKGTAKETGTLRMKLGEEWVELGVHFVKTIPKGLGVIVGLDNQLNCVDLERGEGKLGRHYFSFHMQEDKKEDEKYFPRCQASEGTSTSYVSRRRANDQRRHRRNSCKGTVGKDSRPKVDLPVFRGEGSGSTKGKEKNCS